MYTLTKEVRFNNMKVLISFLVVVVSAVSLVVLVACSTASTSSTAKTPPALAPTATGAPLTVARVAANLDTAFAKIDAGDAASAAASVAFFRSQWPDVEGFIKTKSAAVYTSTENGMAKAYVQLTQSTPDMAGAKATITQMKADLAPYTAGETRYTTFDAFIILFREGLEALLVVAALLAFLTKSGHADKNRWIWAGGAVGIGLSIVVALFINIIFSSTTAGANREVLEGVTGLFAAAMLLWVSYWLHSKSSLGAWQKYIRNKGSAALARNSILSLAFMAFLAVFREGAETILFYIGIAPSISLGSLLAGIGLAVVALSAIGALVLVFGVRVPVRPFFIGASVLIYYLAFKFVGTGIHALQVADKIQSSPARFVPTNDFLGLYPNWEGLIAQGVLVLIAVGVILLERARKQSDRTGGLQQAPGA